MTEIPEYNITFPTEQVKKNGAYKEEVSSQDQIADYVDKYNEHPRVKEHGLLLTKKWYVYAMAIACIFFFIINLMFFISISWNISDMLDKELQPNFPVEFEHNSTVNISNAISNTYEHDIVNNHEIINQLNWTTRYEVDQDAIDEIIDGINDYVCDRDIEIDMVCSFYHDEYNCTLEDRDVDINFDGFYNDTKISGVIEKV